MSGVDFLGKLLNGANVEWKPLGNVIKLEKGRQLNKELLSANGAYPAYNGGVAHSGFTDTFNYTENKIIVSQGGASAGFVNFVATKFYANAHCYVILPNPELAENKYVYHFLKLNEQRLTSKQHGAGIPALRTSEILDIPIPIPCPDNPKKSLEIQAEIVRILDAFTELNTELTTELTTELIIRKKQYNHYRDQLLSFEDGQVEWKTLKDVASFRRGSFPQPYGNSEWYDGEGCMPFVQVADVADAGFALNRLTNQKISRVAQAKSVFVEAGTVLVTLQGTIGRVAIAQYDCYVDRTIAIFTSYKTDIDKKYFAYQLKAKFDFEKEYARGSTLKTITKEEFSEFQIPIPPLAEQARIVAILDKFDALTNSLTEGLPREIELRQKQYAYYRDLLLSFPKPQEVAA